MNKNSIEKLTTYIEENLRATVNSGMSFIDPNNFKSKLASKQNHVVFGRRGSGKSSLSSSLRKSDKHIFVYINLENFKDISFPNIILHVLKSSYLQIRKELKRPFYKPSWSAYKSRNNLLKAIKKLEQELEKPDNQTFKKRNKEAESIEIGAEGKGKYSSLNGGAKSAKEQELETTFEKDKLETLKLSIDYHQEFFNEMSNSFDNKPIYLILDDMYFLNKGIQPYFIDYFHRLSKGTNLYIKVATIKHRSLLYQQVDHSYIGTEIGHDIHDLDLDYTLDKFEDLKNFMKQLLEHASTESKANLNIDDLFAGDSFSQLCLASGGVPRDFLSLFLKLSDQYLTRNQKINKVAVTDAAIASIGNKMVSINKDSENESDILEDYLNEIKQFVYTKHRTNSFLVAKQDLDKYKQIRQALRELVDMRLIHIIDSNTSCAPSDGRRYEAYIIDVGLYENSKPRNFTQIEPGAVDSKGRKDKIRASPKLNFEHVHNNLASKNTNSLFETDL